MNQAVNETLRAAVAGYDVNGVKKCLERGADANYTVEIIEPGAVGVTQPETLLQLVAFRISDCMLEDEDLKAFLEITRLLLAHGADPRPAVRIAEERYGSLDAAVGKETLFAAILVMIAEAAKGMK